MATKKPLVVSSLGQIEEIQSGDVIDPSVLSVGEPIDYTMEVPTGLINSSNTSYTISQSPESSESILVILNGLVRKLTTDYSISGTTITFTFAPSTGSSLFVFYINGTGGGNYKSSTGPEGVVTAPVGALCTNTTNLSLYRKAYGTGNTGWLLVQTAMPPFWTYEIESSFTALNPTGFTINSTGSGVTYWPTQDSFLLVDNTISNQTGGNGPSLYEYSRNGTFIRRIVLASFTDPEEIHWITGNTFSVSQERNTGTSSIDEIVVIDLPTGSSTTSVNISTATLRIQINNITSVSNTGIEGFALHPDGNFYFVTEKAATTPSEWDLWKVPYTGSGTQSVAATKVSRINPIVTNDATDLSGMACGPDGHLWLLSDEGFSTTTGKGRILRIKTDARLVEQSNLPNLADFVTFTQAEGMEIFIDSTGIPRIAICGEDSGGVDFMILKPA